jgi:hypothetical protein
MFVSDIAHLFFNQKYGVSWLKNGTLSQSLTNQGMSIQFLHWVPPGDQPRYFRWKREILLFPNVICEQGSQPHSSHHGPQLLSKSYSPGKEMNCSSFDPSEEEPKGDLLGRRVRTRVTLGSLTSNKAGPIHNVYKKSFLGGYPQLTYIPESFLTQNQRF